MGGLIETCAAGNMRPMSTVAEIERAIEKLPPAQWLEIRHWMDRHLPKVAEAEPARELARFEDWLGASTGIAKGRFTTDERMRETRGED